MILDRYFVNGCPYAHRRSRFNLAASRRHASGQHGESFLNTSAAAPAPACRHCRASLENSFVDLGVSPLCQTHIPPERANHMEPFYPLHAWVCGKCFLVQLEEYVTPDSIFSADYPYFSSYSDSWVAHAKRYAEMMQSRFSLDADSLVMEIASNDGYLLQHFVAVDIPVLGIEPTANTAAAARDKNVRTKICFHGAQTARDNVSEFGQADVLLGNNVLAHVPDLADFVVGMKILLKDSGVITMEFPHLQRLMEENQFDTIYHEHFSYFSLRTVQRVFSAHGLELFDVEELPTHGGSLRIFAQHPGCRPVTERVTELAERERRLGFETLEHYQKFGEQVIATKRRILSCLIGLKDQGKHIVGYGAPGKGNTLLNYCGIGIDILDYTVDRNPHKQGNLTPGSRIPILDPEKIRETRPDYIFILPWNLKTEIMKQLDYVREWGGKFIVPIPEPKILP